MGSRRSGGRVSPAPFNIAIASEWMPDRQALAADNDDGDSVSVQGRHGVFFADCRMDAVQPSPSSLDNGQIFSVPSLDVESNLF